MLMSHQQCRADYVARSVLIYLCMQTHSLCCLCALQCMFLLSVLTACLPGAATVCTLRCLRETVVITQTTFARLTAQYALAPASILSKTAQGAS